MNKYKTISSFIFSFLLLSPIAMAANHLVLIGGGGEPKGQNTIFDRDLKSLGENSTFNDWKKTVIFNGGHSSTERLMSDKFKDANITPNFTRANYDSFLKDTINKIKSGEIKPGDQMLINILTHGAEREKNKEKSHRIALSGGSLNNYETLSGTPTVSLDTLQELINVADQKGVKLGIANLSCFSGNLLNLDKKSACLIAQSIPESYSMASIEDSNPASFFYNKTGFASNFFNKIKKGSTLEEAFLAGRKNNRMLDYPLISTPTNDEVNKFLVDRYREVADITDIFAQILGSAPSDLPTLHTSDLNVQLRQYNNYTCGEINQLEAFVDNKQFDKLLDAMKSKYTDPDVRAFTDAAHGLKLSLKTMHYEKVKFINIMKEADVIWKRDFPNSAKEFSKFSISSLLFGVEDVFIGNIPEASIKQNKNANDDVKKFVLSIRKAALEVVDKLPADKREFLKGYPQLLSEHKDKEIMKIGDFQAKSTAIYDRLYRQLQTKESNNCSNFKF